MSFILGLITTIMRGISPSGKGNGSKLISKSLLSSSLISYAIVEVAFLSLRKIFVLAICMVKFRC